MNKFATTSAMALALVMSALTAHAADLDMPVQSQYPFAATGFLNGGAAWLDGARGERDLATIVGGGDFVIPITGYWNIQLGGAWRWDDIDFGGGSSSFSITQFQGGGIGFWRDPIMGLFGIEAGLFSPLEGDESYVKVGGVAEYFFDETVTVGGFGGVLLPFDDNYGAGLDLDNGFYAGGHVTFYANENLAFAALARFTELNLEPVGPGTSYRDTLLNVGGKVRYFMQASGIEFYAYGGYTRCEAETTFNGITSTNSLDGAEIMGGIQFHIGGNNNSLVSVDRSNAIDTRAWTCLFPRG